MVSGDALVLMSERRLASAKMLELNSLSRRRAPRGRESRPSSEVIAKVWLRGLGGLVGVLGSLRHSQQALAASFRSVVIRRL